MRNAVEVRIQGRQNVERAWEGLNHLSTLHGEALEAVRVGGLMVD